jgi:hypothetical protein
MKPSRYMFSALVVLGMMNFSACVASDAKSADKAPATAQTAAATTADKATAEAAIKTAKAENEASNKVHHEWRDNRKMLKKAEAALAKGDYETAIKIAKKVTKMAKAAQQQAVDQKDAGPRF